MGCYKDMFGFEILIELDFFWKGYYLKP